MTDIKRGHETALALSCEGSIELVLLMVPEHEARYFSEIYCGLIEALPPATRVVMVVEPKAYPIAQTWLSGLSLKRNIRLIQVDPTLQITPWARDGQLALTPKQGNTPVLLKSQSNTRQDDDCIVPLLYQNSVCGYLSAPFDFEGGNLLITADYLFLGVDSLASFKGHNEAEKRVAFTAALAEFDATPRKLIVIRNALPVPPEKSIASSLGGQPWQEVFFYRSKQGTRQPLFHIDMFLSLAGSAPDGRPRILIGDPGLAARLLGEQTHPFALAEYFDEIAADLSAQGFEVHRNPMAFIYMDKPAQSTRFWYHATSNNVLVQQSAEHGNIVWLPQFGHDHWPTLARIDQYNQNLWQEFGFEVRFVPKCQMLAENVGGIHCMTNVLLRRGSC